MTLNLLPDAAVVPSMAGTLSLPAASVPCASFVTELAQANIDLKHQLQQLQTIDDAELHRWDSEHVNASNPAEGPDKQPPQSFDGARQVGNMACNNDIMCVRRLWKKIHELELALAARNRDIKALEARASCTTTQLRGLLQHARQEIDQTPDIPLLSPPPGQHPAASPSQLQPPPPPPPLPSTAVAPIPTATQHADTSGAPHRLPANTPPSPAPSSAPEPFAQDVLQDLRALVSCTAAKVQQQQAAMQQLKSEAQASSVAQQAQLQDAQVQRDMAQAQLAVVQQQAQQAQARCPQCPQLHQQVRCATAQDHPLWLTHCF